MLPCALFFGGKLFFLRKFDKLFGLAQRSCLMSSIKKLGFNTNSELLKSIIHTSSLKKILVLSNLTVISQLSHSDL